MIALIIAGTGAASAAVNTKALTAQVSISRSNSDYISITDVTGKEQASYRISGVTGVAKFGEYFAAANPGKIQVFQICSDGKHIKYITKLKCDASIVLKRGNKLYAASGNKVYVYNFAKPASPKEEGVATMKSIVADMFVMNGVIKLRLADGSSGTII